MEALLVGVTIVSLLLAITMSAIAWTLWQADRQRTAARAEALEALAFSDHVEDRRIAPLPARAVAPARTRAHQPPTPSVDGPAFDDTPSDDDHWDFALGGTRMDDHDVPALGHHEPRSQGVLPDAMFHATPAAGASGRLWLALAAVALVLTAGVVTFKALHSPEIVAAVAASRASTPAERVGGPRPLELLSLRHSTDRDGAFTVTGLVQNPTDGQSLTQIEAVLYLFDDDGKYFAGSKAALEVPAVEPGDESPFMIKVPATSGVSRYRVGFRRADGRVLAHVDRRGQLPGGTSGDAIDVVPALATPAGAIRRGDGAYAR